MGPASSSLLLPSDQDYAVRIVSVAGQTLPFTLDLRLRSSQRSPEPTARPTAPIPTMDVVGVKNGWYPGEEGWRVNSVGVVRPRGGTPYAIAVMTDGRVSWREGIETIEGIAEKVNAATHVPK